MVHGLSWATVTGSWLGKTPLVQVSTTSVLTCPEMVHQETIMTREIEIWLSDSLSLIRLYKPHSDAIYASDAVAMQCNSKVSAG